MTHLPVVTVGRKRTYVVETWRLWLGVFLTFLIGLGLGLFYGATLL